MKALLLALAGLIPLAIFFAVPNEEASAAPVVVGVPVPGCDACGLESGGYVRPELTDPECFTDPNCTVDWYCVSTAENVLEGTLFDMEERAQAGLDSLCADFAQAQSDAVDDYVDCIAGCATCPNACCDSCEEDMNDEIDLACSNVSSSAAGVVATLQAAADEARDQAETTMENCCTCN